MSGVKGKSGVYKRSKEHIKKIRKFALGKKMTVKNKEKLRLRMLRNNYGYKGDDIKYVQIHNRIKKKLGEPNYCEHCKRTDKKKYEWANKDHKYSLNIDDWFRLCTGCHRKYDIKYNNRRKNQYS